MYSHLKKIYNLLERIDPQYQDYVLLTESQESKSISAAKKLVMQKFGWDEARADEFVRKELRDAFSVLHHNSKAGKFILGLARMFCDGQLADGGIIMRLNSTLELIASDAHINEYDRNLNGMPAQELIDRFAGARKEMGDKDREEINSMEYQENNDYTIVQIDDFEQSSQYGKYTSWCVTHDPDMLDSYTSGGIGQFYFCLKNGFENVPEKQGEGCPLDEYGLSMVAVSVDGDGNLNTCTCRWNHDNGGNDNIMDTKQISQLIGRNFYGVFKPNNKWKNALETAMQRLANGEDPRNIFDEALRLNYKPEYEDLLRVRLFKKYNFLNIRTKQFISEKWFDYAEAFMNDFSLVKINDKFNFISIDGQFLLENGFDYISSFFDCGVAIVCSYENGGIKNLLNKNGELLFDKWFDDCSYHDKGVFTIRSRVNGFYAYNMCDSEGRFLLNEWYEYLIVDTDFRDYNIVWVRKNGLWNFIDPQNNNGEPISEDWYHSRMNGFSTGLQNDKKLKGLTEVTKQVQTNRSNRIQTISNVIDTKGNKLLDEWYSSLEFNFTPVGYGVVTKNVNVSETLQNIIVLKNGKFEIISPNLWFKRIIFIDQELFPSGWTSVEIENGQYNYINENGEFLLKRNVDYIRPFREEIGIIKVGEKLNFIKPNGELLSPNLWFDIVTEFCTRTPVTKVVVNNKENFIDKNGHILSEIWFDEVNQYDFFMMLNYARCKLNGEQFYLSLDGTLSKDPPINISTAANENLHRKLNETNAKKWKH